MSGRLAVAAALKKVNDPELGMNIVDLGLVYGVAFTDGIARVTLSLTYPGCPLGPVIIGNIEAEAGKVPGVTKVETEIVWDPAWQKAMMATDALEELKFFGRA